MAVNKKDAANAASFLFVLYLFQKRAESLKKDLILFFVPLGRPLQAVPGGAPGFSCLIPFHQKGFYVLFPVLPAVLMKPVGLSGKDK